MFVHFTPSVEDLLSVINNGLLFRERRRNVWKYLMRDASNRRPEYIPRIYKNREPQQFGMASLHEFIGFPNTKTVEQFGPFGVLVEREWVVRIGFRRVLYVREGDRFHRNVLQPAFEDSLRELDKYLARAPSNDSFPLMAYHNAAVAEFYGASQWASFLRLYEILEPAKHRYQQEWRYSNPNPDYSGLPLDALKMDLDEKCGWSHVLNVLKLDPNDIIGFICPVDCHTTFRTSLPTQFSEAKIFSTRGLILRSMLKKSDARRSI